MTMRLRITHRTEYRYDAPVTSSYNEARLTPQTTATQTVLSSSVQTHPSAATLRYWDYWGTQVTAFDLHAPHERLEVLSTSTVETGTDVHAFLGEEGAPRHVGGDAGGPPYAATGGWARLHDRGFRDRHAELLAVTRYTAFDEEMSTAAKEVASQRDPLVAVHRAVEVVRDHLSYDTVATGVRTTAAEAWRAGSGVCQDFAHVMITLLRRAGVPARYVSGYLHPHRDPQPGQTVVGESHAWVEAWVGDEAGAHSPWLALDPTNGVPAGQRHVVVGRARDYADVAPLRGIYAGAGASTLHVSVEMTRQR